MNIVWIILAVLSFIGGQAYLFYCLGLLDKFLKHWPGDEPASACDDSCRYPDEDVVE